MFEISSFLNYLFFKLSGMLRINHQTGEVNLIKRLDREKRNLLIFQVAVIDNGIPSLNDTAKVTLYISDENDNVPRIFPDTFEISISEVTGVITFLFPYKILQYRLHSTIISDYHETQQGRCNENLSFNVWLVFILLENKRSTAYMKQSRFFFTFVCHKSVTTCHIETRSQTMGGRRLLC